ncbi:MAG: sugar ABC transporter ATP-binding protein [Lachnospiraceae bacterium]|nr:sugar ABC transporter ATP-binding protein [Lachnospiraceae bacterium]
MANYMLEMRNIKKSFYGTTVLHNVNFGVKAGEVHILLGENGAGKSTLMKVLSGVHRPDSGEIMLNGQKCEFREPAHSLKKGIGMVYQELSLAPNMSVLENIWLGNLPKKSKVFVDWKMAKRKAEEVFEKLDIPIDVTKRVSKYDLGLQQLVEIFRVIYQDAKLIVLDEPTSSLSEMEVRKLFETINLLRSQGVSFIYITHKLDEVFEIGDRVTVLRDGEVIGETVEDIKQVTKDDLIKMMVGRDLEDQYPKEPAVTDDVMLRVEHLTDGKNFHDVSFSIRKGEVLGVAGLVGAGNSELAEAVFGLRKIKGGKIYLNGSEYKVKDPVHAINNHIGLLTRDRRSGLIGHMPLYVNISVAQRKSMSNFGFRLRRKERAQARDYIEKLRIETTSENKLLRNLSGGNQQKVAVAKWICNGTRLFVMDDPTRGVDVGAKVEIYKLINSLTAQGDSVLMISSDMPELLGISDNIMVMQKGRVSAMLSAAGCTQEKIFEKMAGEEAHISS